MTPCQRKKDDVVIWADLHVTKEFGTVLQCMPYITTVCLLVQVMVRTVCPTAKYSNLIALN